MAFGQLRIDEMFAFVVVDDDGTEGVIGIPLPGGSMIPMVGADMDRVGQYVPIAKQLAAKSGKAVEVIKFSERSSIRTIKPGGTARQAPRLEDQADRAAAAAPHERIQVQMFDEPVGVHAAVMSGVVVSPALGPDGGPAIGLVFLDEEGKELPPILIAGPAARDLGPLAADAWRKAQQATGN